MTPPKRKRPYPKGRVSKNRPLTFAVLLDRRAAIDKQIAEHPDNPAKKRTYVTGRGQTLVNTHLESEDCKKYGCSIHNPTDPHKDWPTHWRDDRALMERICPHGIGHPDKDHMAWYTRTWGAEKAYYEGVHGCDGCCTNDDPYDDINGPEYHGDPVLKLDGPEFQFAGMC